MKKARKAIIAGAAAVVMIGVSPASAATYTVTLNPNNMLLIESSGDVLGLGVASGSHCWLGVVQFPGSASAHTKNRFFSFITAMKIADRDVTIDYDYPVNGNCEIKSFYE
jgi:hypothetical protein